LGWTVGVKPGKKYLTAKQEASGGRVPGYRKGLGQWGGGGDRKFPKTGDWVQRETGGLKLRIREKKNYRVKLQQSRIQKKGQQMWGRPGESGYRNLKEKDGLVRPVGRRGEWFAVFNNESPQRKKNGGGNEGQTTHQH